MAPHILPRAEHTVSRKGIDPDAIKVLYRLKKHGFLAYLVGGGVRDLLVGRKPKDFDVGTDAHPAQVKKLFRNCFIVGRRFRLCHIRFGQNVIETSTFRCQAPPESGDTLIRRDNTFGTPEQDAFRRDFTVNALFYDIATFSVIDHVGGLADLEQRVIRTIGDPAVRFREDPVRMLRAVALAARLDFSIDPDTLEAIRFLRSDIVRSSPHRILEELYKILRQGAARKTFEMLHETGLLVYLMPEAEDALAGDGQELLDSLARLDEYRNAGLVSPGELTNSLLLASLLVPLSVSLRRVPMARPVARDEPGEGHPEPEEEPLDVAAEIAALGGGEADEPTEAPEQLAAPIELPFARRDLDRIRLILTAQRRLRDLSSSPSAKHTLAGRGYFGEALRWMEIHGGIEGRELALHWRSLDHYPDLEKPARASEPASSRARPERPAPRRRRRRRRPRRPPAPSKA